MPTPLSESISSPAPTTAASRQRSATASPLLPLHDSAEQQRFQVDRPHGRDVELDSLTRQTHKPNRIAANHVKRGSASASGSFHNDSRNHHYNHEEGNRYTPDSYESDYSDEDIEANTRPLLLQDQGRPGRMSSSQMKRSKRGNPALKRRSSGKPGLISTSSNEDIQSNGGMESHFGLRRKESSFETPATRNARLMERSDFSLDDEPPRSPQASEYTTTSFLDLPINDKRNFLLLCLLYFLQGIPLGLATGSVPFLLKPFLSYGQIGVFSLASYPYSLKLLWSPIVDAVWSQSFGRRKSWITPIQTISGIAMIYLGRRIDTMMVAAGENGGAGVWGFTGWWFLLVFFCATQDIAVDGWAISLLSAKNVAYASTAQTVGLTAGQFLSYTVFLAFNSPDFANTWIRKAKSDQGLLTLGGYLGFWGWAYLLVTLGLVLLKREERSKDRDGIAEVYKSMLGVLKLKNIHTIILVHLIAKIGFQANDAVTSLKLLDKGFGQDNMALVVLIDFPFEIALGYYAGKWSTQYTPMRVWCWAFIGRLLAAVFAQATVMIAPEKETVPVWFIFTVIGEHVFSTFMSTVMFVAVSAFHARVSDPAIGGTYMTLLAT